MRTAPALSLVAATLLGAAAQAQAPSPPPPPGGLVQAALVQMLREAQQREATTLVHAKVAEAELAAARSRIAELEAKPPACKP